MQTYMRQARAARAEGGVYPTLCIIHQVTQAQDSTSGMDQNAIRDSLKFEARFVTISDTVIKMKNIKAMPMKGKYQVTSSLQKSSTT